MQHKIKYSDIIALGFMLQPITDEVYFNEYGYEYVFVHKDLTKRIYLDWGKETQLCEIVRMNKKGNIKKRKPIQSLAQLKEIIDFFYDEKDSTVGWENAC